MLDNIKIATRLQVKRVSHKVYNNVSASSVEGTVSRSKFINIAVKTTAKLVTKVFNSTKFI